MGRRSAAETVIAIVTAFLERSSWSQAELARRIGIQTPQVRKHLLELERQGVMPLESEADPPHVVWSVPRQWFPGGLHVTSDDAQELLRQLARAPANEQRDRLLVAIATASRNARPQGVVSDDRGRHEEEHLRVVEDAVMSRSALLLRYTSVRLGLERERVVSVQRVLAGALPRFVAHCHTANDLRFFRVSRIHGTKLDPSTPFILASEADVDAFVATSVAGYRDPIEPLRVAFTVREPELRWVADTLPIAMEAEPVGDGVRFSAMTSGVLALARFVVGLGQAARADTPELVAVVHELAQGALAANSPPIRSVTPIRSTGSHGDMT